MSYRLRNKTRPQADIEIYGGPLHQSRFDGGMNIDAPASEIRDNELAGAVNIICREHGVEPRPGTIEISEAGFHNFDAEDLTAFVSNPLRFGTGGTNYKNTVIKGGEIRYYGENPKFGVFQGVSGYDYQTGFDAGWDAGSGDTTVVPYRRGFMIFNSAKISYAERSGAFKVNSPNPVHGIKDDNAAGAFQYRYLLTLSRLASYAADGTQSSGTGAFAIANRLVAASEVVHESGTNDARYNNAGTSTARQTSYGEVFRATAISVSSPYALTNADLLAAFSTSAGVANNLAARHFTHVTIWRTCDFGAAGAALGNNKAIFYWVGDVLREDVVGSGAGFSDTLSDKSIQDTGIIVQTQGYTPMPSGSCGIVAGGWMFVSDRTNTVSENYLNYCTVSQFPQNIGYHFKDIQKWRFNQGIRALRATAEILSIFCESSTHICNMTSTVASASNLQSVPFLNYFNEVDGSIGVKDWATVDSIDKNTFIAVCSDNSVRVWDTTKWGDDLAYDKCSTEIQQIVPASVENYEQGSVGKYYNGAYYLYYSKDISDSATTHCLRYGFGKKSGYGWSFYEDGPMPNFKRGITVSDNSQGVQRLLIIDASTSKFYWVETFKPFVGATDVTGLTPATHQMDRVDRDFVQYENDTGNEIASSWKFRELISSAESNFLIHDETFHRWRPRVAGGSYNSDMSVSMSAYKDGSATAWETITEQPRTGSLKFQKEVAARRVQLEVATDTAGWKYVGIESNFRSLDKKKMDVEGDASSSDSTISYPQHQAALGTDLDLWLSRRDAGLDRATGVQMTEAGAGQPTMSAVGPDGKTDSAYLFVGDPVNDHDYTETWTAVNSYWTYGGDEDFSTYPGYMASNVLAFSASAALNGGPLFALPFSVATYPLKMRTTVRVRSNNATNTAFCIWDVASDIGFVGDYASFILSYQVSTDTYHMEVFGQKSGNPAYDVLTDLNIPQSADADFIVDIEINATGYKVSLPEYGIYLSDTGWVFSTITYIDVVPQRTDAANQGMVKETRLWTDEPGTGDARYDEATTIRYQNDFAVSFWIKEYAYGRDIFRVDGVRPLYVQLIDATHIDVAGLGVVTLTAVGTGWNHIFINRIGTSITVYQNGVLKGTFTDANTDLGGGAQVHVGPTNLSGYVADVRLFDNDKTLENVVYYYDNVLNFGGDQVMPQV